MVDYYEMPLPSGIRATWISTRDNPEAFKNRGWQKSVGKADPALCTMEIGRQVKQIVPGFRCEGYHVRLHPRPYFDPTYIITPDSCEGWDESRVRTLGGQADITAVMGLSVTLVEMLPTGYERIVLVHAEASNDPVINCHLKWHIENYDKDTGELSANERFARQLPWIVYDDNVIRGALGGCLDGQLFLYSTRECLYSEVTTSLAKAIGQIIALYAKKFMSTQGLPPDFSILVSVAPDGRFRCASYMPKLRHLGGMEYTIGVTAGGQLLLACSPETMHRYLIGG